MTDKHTDYELEAVPANARRGFWTLLAVMLGFTFFSASMWAGGTLGEGLSLARFAAVVLSGNLVLGAYAGHRLHYKIDQKSFARILALILVAPAIRLLFFT